MRKTVLLLVTALSSFCAFSQEKKMLDSINFYGIIRAHVAAFDDQLQVQENAPRIGTLLFRKIDSDWTANVNLEFGLHMIKGVNFNNNANSASEFIANPLVKEDAFFSRLAYIGLAHKKWGSITIGKQWGVYSDIGFYTDDFSLFGGAANGTYAGGTDGGWKGTGRADNAIQYRNKFGRFQLGAQTQLFGDSQSYGVSAQYNFPFGLTIGSSYNDVEIQESIKKFVIGIGDNSSNFIAGAKYKKGKYYAAFTFSVNDDAFVVIDDETAVSFPTYGSEVLLGYTYRKKWYFEGGYNLIVENKSNTYYQGNFRLLQYMVGTNYLIAPDIRIYLIARMSDSKFAEIKDNKDVIALGFRYDFNLGKKYN